jgi:hypothetical protein
VSLPTTKMSMWSALWDTAPIGDPGATAGTGASATSRSRSLHPSHGDAGAHDLWSANMHRSHVSVKRSHGQSALRLCQYY